jgi:hypothetical protein
VDVTEVQTLARSSGLQTHLAAFTLSTPPQVPLAPPASLIELPSALGVSRDVADAGLVTSGRPPRARRWCRCGRPSGRWTSTAVPRPSPTTTATYRCVSPGCCLVQATGRLASDRPADKHPSALLIAPR